MTEKRSEFQPLYFRESLDIINPCGCVGVVSLWSERSRVRRRFEECGIDLAPDTSPIAAFGNLYGNGLKHLLVNLLYNPQISYLVVCGNDRSGSRQELEGFFARGVEAHVSLGVQHNRIVATNRLIDARLSPGLFKNPPTVISLGDITEPDFDKRLVGLFRSAGFKNCGVVDTERVRIELTEPQVASFPCNHRGFTIIKETPLEAWKELIFCLHRFAPVVNLGAKKGHRKELQNVKVVVERPAEEPADLLARYGFDLEAFHRYQQRLLSPDIRGDETYNYGNRINAWFGVDSISECVRKLRDNPQDRGAFIGLWDARSDLTKHQGRPCMVSIFPRVFDGRLTLNAIFRTHNAVDAWLQNFYGLMNVRDVISRGIGIPPGAVTIISHSISINTADYERVLGVIEEKEKRFEFTPDPHGQFDIKVEDGLIVATHIYEGNVIAQYKSKKAERIQYELKRDHAISDIGHAIYIGRELEKAESTLKNR
ncbi:protein containing Thymidylate synthase [Candidatus Magnetobacterium bavaricum]|uniref:Protein containing Thymidylate synthase n=1 Tax=Candidatus Magnetobacterium bavaricum TaxID=29290 RepID=A0A0F3GQU0_9BACT|nr:protein containing Thymidylate synthase [Candidatus Magnetobacterium bavaricum]